jgi:hypothetical protein
MISSQIAAVQSIQKRFEARGGVFRSKEKGETGKATRGHKAARKAWRAAKIALTNTIAKFEDLLQDKKIPDWDLKKLRAALDLWDKEKIKLCRVPGLRYVDGAEEGEPTDEEEEEAWLLMVWLEMVVKREMTKEELNSPQQSSMSPNTSRTNPSVAISQPPSSRIHQSERVSRAATKTPTLLQNVAGPKGILKRPHTVTLLDTSASPSLKRVRLSDSVTVSPEHLYVTNPSPFHPLSRTAVIRPHSAHTFADYHRQRPKFHRTTEAYVPGVWSGTTMSETVNTSFRDMACSEMEKQFKEESEEQEQELELARKLKETSRGWVALWWAKKMAPNLDLEKLKMEMKV